MPTDNADEPSLEEILASIRRIISEDGPSYAAAAADSGVWPAGGSPLEEDVLVLTHRVPMNGQPFLHDEPAQKPAPEAPQAGPEIPATPEPEAPPMLAEETENRAAAAFERLEAASRAQVAEPPIALPAAGRTLEDLVREMIQPMIESWLDQNLPDLVQRRVDQEIDRIAHRRPT